jgi:hypothetical protein
MMALIRFIFDFLKKEELVVLHYIRQHPRRNWLIALDALITISLVFGGVAYASQSSKNATSRELMRIGAMPMTASAFMEHAREHANSGHGREYWLGIRKGFGISSDERAADVHFVSYVKDSSEPSDLRGREITIGTYQSSIDIEGLDQFSARVKLSTSVTASGLIVQYDKAAMTDEIVSMDSNSSKVSIHYLVAQSLQTLMDNAMALRIAD